MARISRLSSFLFVSVLSLGFAVAVSGCGGSSSSNNNPPPPPPPPPPSTDPDVRADAMLKQMTQAEKLSMVMGGVTAPNGDFNYTVPKGAGGWIPANSRLGIPALYLADGSVGVAAGVGPSTALPSSIASAATWDLDLATKYGTVIGTELADYGINVNLGGNINLIGRDPRDGRTFETKGEDPILAGKITAAHIKAIQAQHIIGGIKHYAFNDQESGRTTENVIVDERAGRESDLLAFEIGVKDSSVQSVMCSYNLTNGQYDCENKHLLNDVLKGDWKFPGFVMSDWWATHSTATAANNGLDQEEPNRQYFGSLGAAVSGGEVSQTRLDNMVHRVLRAMYAVGVFDDPLTEQPLPATADAKIAQDEEEAGAVLLKNAGAVPMWPFGVKSIAVIGYNADKGVLSGAGSAQVQPVGGAIKGPNPCPPCWARVVWDPSSPLDAIKAEFPNTQVTFADGTDAAAAAALAAKAQTAVVFVNQWASEGMDEENLALKDLTSGMNIDQDALIEEVAAANPMTVVVIESGGPVLMPWLDHVAGVLEAWYPGQSGGPAIARLLSGSANPSGKLPVTFPASDAQLPRPVTPQPPDGSTPFDVPLTEGYNVGYKWFDAQGLTPLFPFGYGLSYSSFSVSQVSLLDNTSSSTPGISVLFTITNTGSLSGAEVEQVYLGMPASLNEAPHRLVAWKKIYLETGAQETDSIQVDENDSSHPLSYWDTTSGSWKVAPGTYTVYLGNSSRNLTEVGTFTVQ